MEFQYIYDEKLKILYIILINLVVSDFVTIVEKFSKSKFTENIIFTISIDPSLLTAERLNNKYTNLNCIKFSNKFLNYLIKDLKEHKLEDN